MKQKLLTVLGNIKLYSSYYFAIVSILGAMWGAFAMYDNWRDSNKILQNNVNQIMNTQKVQSKTDSIILVQQTQMRTQLNEIQSTSSSLQSSYVKYISNDKTLTKQDFLKYMEGLSFDTKKNELSDQTGSIVFPLSIPSLLPNYDEGMSTVSK